MTNFEFYKQEEVLLADLDKFDRFVQCGSINCNGEDCTDCYYVKDGE